MKKPVLAAFLLSMLLFTGCAAPVKSPVIVDERIHSAVLDKDIPIKVYLPKQSPQLRQHQANSSNRADIQILS